MAKGWLKYTTQDMHKLAEEKGFNFLSESYKGITTKHLWKCSQGHIWEAIPNAIRNGNGCKKCAAAQLRSSIEDAHRIAKSRDFEFISTKYNGMKKKHKWKCTKGHIWMSTVQNIRRGTNCPTCSKKTVKRQGKYITEKRVRFIFEQLTQKKFPSDWHTLGNGQQLDGYCEELKVAFEYQGPQHYYIDGYWNKKKKDLNYQQVRDRRKARICQHLQIVKIDIPYTVAKPLNRLREYIKNKLETYGIIIER